MRLGICTSIDNAKLARASGFDYLEINAAELLPGSDDTAFAQVRAKAESAPLSIEVCNCFIPRNLKVVGPQVDQQAMRTHMETSLRRCGELGISIMVFGSGFARQAPDGFPLDRALEQYSEAVLTAANIGEQYGVTIVMEPLRSAECNVLNTVEEGIRIVDSLNHPYAKVLADSTHMVDMQEPFSHIGDAGSRMAHMHIDMPDVDAGEPRYIPEYLSAIRQSGYDGRLSVENHTFRPLDGMQLSDYFPAVHAYLASLLTPAHA